MPDHFDDEGLHNTPFVIDVHPQWTHRKKRFMASTAQDFAMTDSLDDRIIDTPEGPMRWGDWKKKNPVQLPSRRTKGKNLPKKIALRTGKD